MESVENSLSTLRRTGFALVLSALVILFLVAPTGRDFGAALDELGRLREISRAYEAYCAAVASERAYAPFGRGIVKLDSLAGNPMSLSRPVGVAGWVACGLPETDQPLEAYVRFFEGTRGVMVAGVGSEEIYEELARLAPESPGAATLDSLFVLIDPFGNRDAESLLRTVIHDGDTLRMQFVDSRLARSADSLSVVARFRRRGIGSSGYSFRLPLGGTAEYREHPRPLDWLRATAWGDEILESGEGQVVLFPRLRPFWEEVRTLPLPEAVRHLQARADERRGTVQVFGAEVSTSLLGWGGPLVVLAIALYLLAQLRHLAVIAWNEPSALREYPWIALFNDRLSVTLVVISIVLLPALANLALAIRLARTSALAALWAAAVSVACAAAGIVAFARLRDLRKSGGTSA